MTSAISCPHWSSVYDCQRVECAFTSPVRNECGVCDVCDVLYAVLYISVICFVVRGCAVSGMYINVYNSDVLFVLDVSMLRECEGNGNDGV